MSTPWILPTGYTQRLTTITDIASDPTGSAQGRWVDLAVAADIVTRTPVVGVGLGQNVLALNRERGPTWRMVHNVYLQYAVDLGVPGLLLFLWLFVSGIPSRPSCATSVNTDIDTEPGRGRRPRRADRVMCVRRGCAVLSGGVSVLLFPDCRPGAGSRQRVRARRSRLAHAARLRAGSRHDVEWIDPGPQGPADAALWRHRESGHDAQPRTRQTTASIWKSRACAAWGRS